MQKTVLFGINTHIQKQNSDDLQNHFCPNCLKLQKQLDQLHEFLSQKSERNIDEGLTQSVESQSMKLLQIQLQDIKEKYLTFRKKIKLIQKENQNLFQENSNLQKQLNTCRLKLRQFEAQQGHNQRSGTTYKTDKAAQHTLNVNECKRLQIQMFVWRQKTEKLQIMLKSQTDEVNRLKQLLKRRNRLQEQRHKLLAILV